jgi:hypothetical protein
MSLASRVLRLTRSTFFWGSVLAALFFYTLYAIYSANRKVRDRIQPPQQSTAPAAPKPLVPPSQPLYAQVGSGIIDIVLPAPVEKEPQVVPKIPQTVRDAMLTPPVSMSLFPIKLTPVPAQTVPPDYYLPSFRLIRCKLANAVESGSGESPLIGYVLEDQFNIDAQGISRLVIPAGLEIHGTAGPPVRDRITSSGKWTFVWRTTDLQNAHELPVQALALNRDFDPETGIYGLSDGGPGIAGTRIDNTNDKEIKSLALAFISATTRAFKSSIETLNPLTNQLVSTSRSTKGNALLEGAAASVDEAQKQIERIRGRLELDGFYVAVLPGAEFYLYTKEPIDLRLVIAPGQVPRSNAPTGPAGLDPAALLTRFPAATAATRPLTPP